MNRLESATYLRVYVDTNLQSLDIQLINAIEAGIVALHICDAYEKTTSEREYPHSNDNMER